MQVETPKRKPLPNRPGLDHITLLDRQEVAQRLGIRVWTLSRWIKSGQFPRPIRVTEKKYGWRVIDVALWIEKKMREPYKPRALRGATARHSQHQPSVKRERLYA